MGMWSLLDKGMVPLSMAGQTMPSVYCHIVVAAAIFEKEWSGKNVEF